jgi:hypothetical protein
MISFSASFPEESSFENPSVSLRKDVALLGLARVPRAIGDHGITLPSTL